MSRLQVGGLALIIDAMVSENIGKVVRIKAFTAWGNCEVKGDDLIGLSGNKTKDGVIPPKWLMPLGDDQTQAEFRKELDELVF
ncbi:hypothetical protein [uncultured Acinetobacter sp.]|uniref:hypothetical protein n=2 Tax=uncultured Acinetobacter sp. TaxID=165433 RepID=UPI002584F690|nr:hypothetical protein [uncultured Acinetobacter sp.]